MAEGIGWAKSGSMAVAVGLYFAVGVLVVGHLPSPASGLGDIAIGPGRWHVLSVTKCSVPGGNHIYVERRRLNRTHDHYNANGTMVEVVSHNYGIRMEVCMFLDGGCKAYQTMVDPSLPHFLHQYAEENMHRFLVMAGIDPPDFPIPKGFFEVIGFVIDYNKLPRNGVYGRFRTKVVTFRGGEDMTCGTLEAEFTPNDDEDYEDEDEDEDGE